MIACRMISCYLCRLKKEEMKRLLLNIMRYFLPILFVSYMASITFFGHAHVINGVTVVHSHPFKKGSGHYHSSVELQLIHFLSNPILDGGQGLLIFSFFLFCSFLLFKRSNVTHYRTPFHGIVALRAPPVGCLS